MVDVRAGGRDRGAGGIGALGAGFTGETKRQKLRTYKVVPEVADDLERCWIFTTNCGNCPSELGDYHSRKFWTTKFPIDTR